MNEPQLTALPTIRHDSWTGEKMAIFCETLAETAVVAKACEAARMGISGAYAARRRNPVFAPAWEGQKRTAPSSPGFCPSLTIARERLADTLLARSMEGNIEQIKDGELVGERHVLDNRLGLQILRRLDRMAEHNMCSSGGRSPVRTKTLDPCVRRGTQTIDWALAVDALRTGDDESVAKALALIDGDKVEEVEGAPNRPLSDEENEGLDLTDRCWKDGIDDIWMTDFPPPADFTGYESRPYDDIGDEEPYVRACIAEEIAILEADAKRARDAERAEDEMLRDA